MAVLLVVVLIPVSPASGVSTVGVDARDARRDVEVFTRTPGPPVRDRRSIDLRRIVAAPTPQAETVRFRVRIARLLPEAPFDQVADVLLLPPKGADVAWYGTEIWMSVRHPRTSFAAFYSDAGPVRCPRLHTASDPATGWFWLDVPRRCLPPGEATVEVETLATVRRNDSPPYSRDTLAVPGTVVWEAA